MKRRPEIALTVCLACGATLIGHWWLNNAQERRIERLLSAQSRFERLINSAAQQPLEAPEHAPLLAIDPQSTGMTTTSPPRLLTSANYEESSVDGGSPADASPPAQPRHILSRPLTPREQIAQKAVRDVIEQEMPGVSADERDIWFEELRSLPPEAVRDLLKVRQQMRILTPEHHLSGPSRLFPPPDVSLDPEPLVAQPVTRSQPLSPQNWSDSEVALRQAISWSTHNLANAATPGYKRLRVVLTDALASPAPSPAGEVPRTIGPGSGCRIASLSLDIDPAPIAETGRELDIAIDGPGFFVVYHEPTSRFFYTRCGAWKLTADRRLALAIDDAEYLLDPQLRIPDSVSEIRIEPDGDIRPASVDGSESATLGQIQLARISAPAQLVPQGNGLLLTRHDKRSPLEQPGHQGLGVLRQHALEQSNVDLDFEIAERKLWERLLELFSGNDVPRTAQRDFGLPE